MSSNLILVAILFFLSTGSQYLCLSTHETRRRHRLRLAAGSGSRCQLNDSSFFYCIILFRRHRDQSVASTDQVTERSQITGHTQFENSTVLWPRLTDRSHDNVEDRHSRPYIDTCVRSTASLDTWQGKYICP